MLDILPILPIPTSRGRKYSTEEPQLVSILLLMRTRYQDFWPITLEASCEFNEEPPLGIRARCLQMRRSISW